MDKVEPEATRTPLTFVQTGGDKSGVYCNWYMTAGAVRHVNDSTWLVTPRLVIRGDWDGGAEPNTCRPLHLGSLADPRLNCTNSVPEASARFLIS